MSDLISIIVPVYNVELYLEQCLKSIASQSYKNLEIIIINDGSTDSSERICNEFVVSDNRFNLFNQKNQGLSAARNKGLELATGKYIMFIDSDDFIHSDYVQTLYYLIKKYNTKISEVNSVFYYEGMPFFKHSKKESLLTAREWNTQTKQKKYLSVVVWNKLYEKCLFNNIKFPVGKKFEDEDLTYKVVCEAEYVARSYSRLYAYRQRQNSIMSSDFSYKDTIDRISILEEKVKFLSLVDSYSYDFAIAKLLIYLFSVYDQYDDNFKKNIIDKIKFYYNNFINFSKLPLKYKIFIKMNYFKLKNKLNNLKKGD